MSVLLWFGFACSFLVFIFTVIIFHMGMTAARSPYWDIAIAHAAVKQIDKYNLIETPRTIDQQRALESYLIQVASIGILRNRLQSSLQNERVQLQIIKSITDSNDNAFSILRERQIYVLNRSIDRLNNRVYSIANPRSAARQWTIQLYLERITVSLEGIRWFFPLYFSKMRMIGEDYLTASTFIGVWIGFLVWGFTCMGKPTQYSDLIETIGITMTMSASIGFFATITTQFFSILTTILGPIPKWIRGQIISVTIFLISISVIGILFYSGAISEWTIKYFDFMNSITQNFMNNISIWGTILCLIISALTFYRFIEILRSDYVRRIDRSAESVGILAIAILFFTPLFILNYQTFKHSEIILLILSCIILTLAFLGITLEILRRTI